MLSTFPIDAVRARFPALSIEDDGKPRIYLDNPAGTQVPRSVAQAASNCLLETNANLGGYFTTSVAAEEIVVGAHRAMARFLGAASEREVIVGPSMTSLTFEISRSLGRMLQPGDEIVVTRMDHEGNVSPWLALAEDRGLLVRWLPFNEETWCIEPDALQAVLTKKTRLVALNYASNLTGSINDVRTLVELVHDAGALAYVDAVQLAPHRSIDVQHLGCDFLACSSYKFFGPHLGIVWGREALLEQLYAYKVRPQTLDLPYKFETGTPQIEQLAALRATVAYFENVPGEVSHRHGEVSNDRGRADASRVAPSAVEAFFNSIIPYEQSLAAQLIDGLQRIAGVRIVGISDPARFDRRVPTVSFVHNKRTPSSIAQHLARQNIFVWSGHNFALEVVRQLGIDENHGVVRIGIAHYNTASEIDRTLEALSSEAPRMARNPPPA